MTSLVANGNAHSGISGTVANPLMKVNPDVWAEEVWGAVHFRKHLPDTAAPLIARLVSSRICRHDQDRVGSSADGSAAGVML